MLLSENLSPIFSSKSKSSGTVDSVGVGTSNSTHDTTEHDINILTDVNDLPTANSFEALQVSSER